MLSIHQPRADIFAMFDRLMVLGGGQTVCLSVPGSLTHMVTRAGGQAGRQTVAGNV
jgi:hypothetical protein